jgi:protein ImuB
LATTLARLFALLGPDRVGSPRPADEHRPESLVLVDYDPPPPPEIRTESRQGRGLLTIRVLRPPVALEVLTTDADDPPRGTTACAPREIASTLQEGDAKRPRIEGPIKVASGPWEIENEWWSAGAVEREYWDIELARGGLFRIFRQKTSGEWFADGVYD